MYVHTDKWLLMTVNILQSVDLFQCFDILRSSIQLLHLMLNYHRMVISTSFAFLKVFFDLKNLNNTCVDFFIFCSSEI